jgi:ribonuclease-3 family protein
MCSRTAQLYVRRHFFSPARLHASYVSQVSQLTRAEGQAGALAVLLPLLTAEEVAIVKWGRNAAIGKVPERLRGSGGVYREATAVSPPFSELRARASVTPGHALSSRC